MSRSSAFIIFITLIIFEQGSSGHGIADVRVTSVHELLFGELPFHVIDIIKDEKALIFLIPNNMLGTSETALQTDEKLCTLVLASFFKASMDFIWLCIFFTLFFLIEQDWQPFHCIREKNVQQGFCIDFFRFTLGELGFNTVLIKQE
jgi:hypothetical protein